MSPVDRLKIEFLDFTSKVRYNPGFQGQRVIDGVIYVGDRAGPEVHISNLCHEMSHFVEIDDARMACHSWGLRVPEIVVFGTVFVEPVTLQITEREMRVAAYQANLHEHIGLCRSVRSITDSFKYLPDACFVPIEDGSSAYGDGRTHKLSYRDIEESQNVWLANKVQELRATFTMERFITEWFRKIALLDPKL